MICKLYLIYDYDNYIIVLILGRYIFFGSCCTDQYKLNKISIKPVSDSEKKIVEEIVMLRQSLCGRYYGAKYRTCDYSVSIFIILSFVHYFLV